MSKIKGFIVGTAIGASVIPAAGVLAHFGMMIASDPYVPKGDYSLKNRFECAYCWNVPESHRQYTRMRELPSGWTQDEKTLYMAHPLATYPAILVFGLLGARHRWDEKLYQIAKSNMR